MTDFQALFWKGFLSSQMKVCKTSKIIPLSDTRWLRFPEHRGRRPGQGLEAPTCPRGLIHQPELHVPQTSLFRDSKGKLPPSCPTAGLSPRNSEIRALCPQGPHTPVHVPIRVSPSLRCKMDLLLLWPWPLESERPQCGMRPGCSRKEGGRGDR